MSPALPARIREPAPSHPVGPDPRRKPYLRPVRVQPRRRGRGAIVAWLLVLASLLFLKVWERTEANSLAMERDRLSAEVRALSNRIRLSNELADQAALREGLEFASLRAMGFENPAPGRIVDIDLSRRPARDRRAR